MHNTQTKKLSGMQLNPLYLPILSVQVYKSVICHTSKNYRRVNWLCCQRLWHAIVGILPQPWHLFEYGKIQTLYFKSRRNLAMCSLSYLNRLACAVLHSGLLKKDCRLTDMTCGLLSLDRILLRFKSCSVSFVLEWASNATPLFCRSETTVSTLH